MAVSDGLRDPDIVPVGEIEPERMPTVSLYDWLRSAEGLLVVL